MSARATAAAPRDAPCRAASSRACLRSPLPATPRARFCHRCRRGAGRPQGRRRAMEREPRREPGGPPASRIARLAARPACVCVLRLFVGRSSLFAVTGSETRRALAEVRTHRARPRTPRTAHARKGPPASPHLTSIQREDEPPKLDPAGCRVHRHAPDSRVNERPRTLQPFLAGGCNVGCARVLSFSASSIMRCKSIARKLTSQGESSFIKISKISHKFLRQLVEKLMKATVYSG